MAQTKPTSEYVGLSHHDYRKEQNLLQAARSGNLEKVKQLAALHGYSKSYLNQKTSVTGKTALILAAEENRTDVVRFLCKHGANASIHDAGNKAALAYARDKRDPKCADIISRHIQLNQKLLPQYDT
ncbi:MAG: ankyrin repeat domain-containing protein [Candidatus Paceibacterota bacterium]